MSQLQEMLAEVSGEKTLLEDRFHTLAENHEQMIRIKDEYKRTISRISGMQKKEVTMLEQLGEELKQAQNRNDETGKKCELLDRHVCELVGKMEAERTAHKLKVQEMNSSHSEERNTLKRNLESGCTLISDKSCTSYILLNRNRADNEENGRGM